MAQLNGPYGLGVILYTFLNRIETNSPYYIVAKYILTHMEDLHDVAIKDLAAKTHVSTATISRFCKEIGLQSFAELRNLINDHKRATEPRYDFQNTEDSNSLADSYLSAVQRDIDSLKSTLDLNKLNSLVDDIYHYQNVVTFGAMHMETISLMLQYIYNYPKRTLENLCHHHE